MKRKARQEFQAHGVRALLSRHPAVRRLKRERFPTQHGNRFWSSSWVLMDYLGRSGLPPACRVIDVGCGWGLAGIFCASRYGARVTAVDADPDVFPFLRLHAGVNRVDIATLRSDFTRITTRTLREVDYLIGADICFWDSLVRPIHNLILRALRAGVKGVLIADPGRSPFEAVGESVLSRREGEVLTWTTSRPRTMHGRILRLGDGFR
ncbi:MAG: methyltransferase domain-containing protein [Deltaproteobacteria bacterium]|nr:methyltransferase domain-containing protein [Deltaproteobacteria bacterium]